MDPGVATTETEHPEVLNGGGSGGGGLQDWAAHAQVQRILRTGHGCPGRYHAAHEMRVREGLAKGHRDGRKPSTRAESEDSNASTRCCVRSTRYSSLQRRTVATTWRMVGPLLGLSDPDARPDVHWLPAEASAFIAWHREAAALEAARKQHRELALARAVPARRSTRRPSSETSHLSNSKDRGAKAQRPKTAEQDIKVGGPCFFLH